MDTSSPPIAATRTIRTPSATTPSQVRRLVRETLAGTAFAARTDDAELAASEVATNALLHGRPPYRVRIRVSADAARVEVHDASALSPTFSLLEPAAITGRGLVLVAATSDAFGVDPEPGGKVVWFELRRDGGRPAPDVPDHVVDALLAAWGDQLPGDPADEQVTVVLTDLDTALTAAAEAHVEALLREMELALRGPGGLPDPARQVAQRAVAAAEAFEAVRASLRHQVAVAAAAGWPTVEVRLRMSRRDAELAREYAAALDRADRLCRGDRVDRMLLVVECPAELTEARNRYLSRLVGQLVD